MTKDKSQGTPYEYCEIPDDEDRYYPTKQEQEIVMADARTKNPLLLRLKRIWNEEENCLVTHYNVAKFLQRLFIEDRLSGLVNGRSRLEQRKLLYTYLAKDKSGDLYCTEEELSSWEQESSITEEIVYNPYSVMNNG